jgi:DUF1680 family protein
MSKIMKSALFIKLSAIALIAVSCNTSKEYVPKAIQIVPQKTFNFPAGEVKLLDGPFKESQDAEAKNLLALDMDRLLAPFLIESGLTPKGEPYSGWEKNVLPGVALSFYLSGSARLYMSTGNVEFLKRLNYALDELETCQQKNDGYILGTKNGKKIFARVEKEGCFPEFGHWKDGEATPYYSLEKLMSGLRDVYRICHIQKALQISNDLGNWLCKHMSFITDTELQKIMRTEYGGMNWVLSDLYADTGDKRYLELSKRWQDIITVVPMVQGNDVLNGVHANMQFPKYSGLAARYPYSGDAGDLFGARFFWESVVNHRTYVTGGNSESEFFGPKDSLSHRLTPFTEENCNEYNLLRLTSLLYQIEPRVEYADFFERTLYNHILASQNPADNKVCYFLPLMPGAGRVYHLLEEFSCCVCSALDSYTRHAEYIYSHSDSAIFVNLFIASELDFKEKGIALKQETIFPDQDISTLTIKCNKAVKLDLCIRNPYWADNAVTIKINGNQQKISASIDGYFHVQRTWLNADVVELKLPMNLRTESMPDDNNMIALFYGPVLLAANLDGELANSLLMEEVAPALVPGELLLNEWLKPTGVPLTYTTTILKPRQVEVLPFYRKKTGPYSVYWQKLSESEWTKREAIKQQKLNDEKKLDIVTIDKVMVGDSISESNHHLTGESWTGFGNGGMYGKDGILSDMCWRRSSSGSFGYDILVSDSEPNALFCRYMGRGCYERWSCRITIDGITIQTLKLGKLEVEAYSLVTWHTTYAIPAELTKGKKKVTVLFEPLEDNSIQMPRLMEMRIIKL